MEHFNKLTPAEAERLALLAEECGEVIQAIGKILRHGYESYHPNDVLKTSNRRLLERELGDVQAAVLLMSSGTDLSSDSIESRKQFKLHHVQQYLHHQEDV